MADQITELENRFIIDGEECQYVVDTTPQAGSTAFVTSGGVYTWLAGLAKYRDRSIATEVSQFNQQSTDIPTVGLIWQILKNNNVI
jgi:hypothetical protein